MGFAIVQRRFASRIRLFTLLALLLSVCSTAIAVDVTAVDAKTALQDGMSLEQDRNWREAIRVYRAALKKWKDDDALKLGLRRSQFHYSIDRRYLDESFKTSLKPMSRDAALSLYDDVIVNVQGYYVEPISVSTIVAHGTESLWLALGNEKFVETNIPNATDKQVEQLRRQLYEGYWNKRVPHRFSAQEVVTEVCELCRSQVGLDCGPVIMEYTFGACNCLDDYSSVLTPTKDKDLTGNIEGKFVGIGIVMESDLGAGMKLEQVLPESPAHDAGLKRGDVISAVDGKDCRYMSTEEAASLLSGKSGSRVQLQIERERTAPFSVQCVRREVKIKSVAVAKMIDSQNGIGYIQMTGFQQNTTREMDDALRKLSAQGMKMLIWDLRENPGGLLNIAVEVADRFISDGVIVSTRGRAANQSSSYTAHAPGTWNMPLLLLIDENSASASEIIAGTIRDHHRGKIVGRTSFGKWSVQTIFRARFGTSIRLTTAKFYSPNGDTWGKIGLKPDILVEKGPEDRPLGDVDLVNDPDLQAALKLFTSQEYTKRN